MITPDARQATGTEVLRLAGVTKRFGTTVALKDVTMSVLQGEVRALIGRNGAGKSTLISIITGLQSADEGTLSFPAAAGEGQESHPAVACVYQKSTLVPHLTAAENIFLDAYPTNALGFVDWAETVRRARTLLADWKIEKVAEDLVSDLDPLQCKIVEICRALSTGARILLLDEPTAGLDGDATRHLFSRMSELTAQGISIVYVSHYLDEIFEVCDTVTIVRDGAVVRTDSLKSMTMTELVDAMVGETRAAAEALVTSEQHAYPSEAAILEVKGLTVEGQVDDFSVQIRPGECVGLVGLEGSGIIDAAEAIAGLDKPTSGHIRVRGREITAGNVTRAIKAGIGFLPEDRHESGFVPGMSNEENATLSILGRLKNRAGLIDGRARRSQYGALSQAWEIKAASFDQATEELSGGNQQKVALARAFASQPDVLILANPTAGVDVSAKSSIVQSISETVHTERTACLIVSSDESEFQPCSRVLVMFRGRLIGELTAPWTENALAAAVQGDLGAQPDGTIKS